MTDPIGPIRAALAGRYEIERKIGEGAFATVYLARDLRHDRLVVFKVLNADPTSEDSELRFCERFGSRQSANPRCNGARNAHETTP